LSDFHIIVGLTNWKVTNVLSASEVVKKKPTKHKRKRMDELIICSRNFEKKKLLTSL
jgi:hypothetical protein